MQQNKPTRSLHRRTAEEKRALLDALATSGLSVREFARREGIQKTCLWRWKREQEEKTSSASSRRAPTIAFAPVRIATQQIEASQYSARGVLAEVVVAENVFVRVFRGADAAEVSRLVRALAGGARC